VHGRLREQVVVEVLGKLVEHLVVRLGERGERVVLFPRRCGQERTGELELLAVLLPVRRLVDRVPHHVVRVHQRDDEEPRPIGRPRVVVQPLDALIGDDRVVLPAGARPPHEVAIVAPPVGEAVRLEVRLDRMRKVPLTDVRGAVTGGAQDRTERRDRGVELAICREDHVVDHTVLRDVPPREQARPRRRARRRVRVVTRELEAAVDEPLPMGERETRRDPSALALLVRHDEQDVGAVGHRTASLGR
jgi:hypothetical protein